MGYAIPRKSSRSTPDSVCPVATYTPPTARKFFSTFARKFAYRGCAAYPGSSAVMRFQVNNSVPHFPNAIRYLNILIKFPLPFRSARSLPNPRALVHSFRFSRFLSSPLLPLFPFVLTGCFFTLR